jgi:hypothetical protein
MLERHKKKLEEIKGKKVKAQLNTETEVSVRLNENKK